MFLFMSISGRKRLQALSKVTKKCANFQATKLHLPYALPHPSQRGRQDCLFVVHRTTRASHPGQRGRVTQDNMEPSSTRTAPCCLGIQIPMPAMCPGCQPQESLSWPTRKGILCVPVGCPFPHSPVQVSLPLRKGGRSPTHHGNNRRCPACSPRPSHPPDNS